MEIINEKSPIICANCLKVEIRGEYLYCLDRNRTVYNAKPSWCPYPTWIEKYECEDGEEE